MKRTVEFISVVIAIVTIFVLNVCQAQYVSRPALKQSGTKGRPNIVIICVDAMGISDLSCYGSEIKTPAIDKIAAQGVRFTTFYNSGSATSTRASLLTGQYPHSAGLGYQLINLGMTGYYGTINKETPTLAEILKEKAGYQTLMVGRWGLSRDIGQKGPSYNWPTHRGFDFFYGTLALSDNQFNPSTLKMGDKPFSVSGHEFYYTSAIANQAEDFLKEAGKKDAPFFLYISMPGPYMPLHVPTQELTSKAGQYSIGWDQIRHDRYKNMLAMRTINQTTKLSPRDENVPDWSKMGSFARWQSLRMEMYAIQVEATDRAIGRIMEAVSMTGRTNETLVIFLSASGANARELPEGFKSSMYMSPTTRAGHKVLSGNNPRVAPGTERTYQSYGVPWANVSNTPYRGYAESTYEGGLSSPCIIQYPRTLNPGRVSHQVMHAIDIVPTILDIIELNYPQQIKGIPTAPLAGKSCKGVLQMKTFEREPLFWEFKGNVAVRAGKWKLVAQYSPEGENQRIWELYDMETDRAESNNLVSEYGSMAQEMFREYTAWAKKNHVRGWKEVSQKIKEVQQKATQNVRRE